MNYYIPEKEVSNFISVYWQMLRELEACHCDNDTLNKRLVEGAYNVLNRSGVTDQRPEWDD